jgi:hypothetical protein
MGRGQYPRRYEQTANWEHLDSARSSGDFLIETEVSFDRGDISSASKLGVSGCASPSLGERSTYCRGLAT